MKVKAECTINLGNESLTSEEVGVEVLDKEGGNMFLEISMEDKKTGKASLIISTDDLKKILEVGREQLLKKAVQDPDDELINLLREHGYSQAAIKKILELYQEK